LLLCSRNAEGSFGDYDLLDECTYPRKHVIESQNGGEGEDEDEEGSAEGRRA
jgi:hypothetical protein